MNKPIIVSGEASETESEDETPVYKVPPIEIVQIKGQLVVGEDSESDNDELSASVASASSVKTTIELPLNSSKNDSLLHQKLFESNSNFYNNLEDYIKNVVETNEKTLNEIDQQILKSQLVIQGSTNNLKNFNTHSNSLKKKLDVLLSSNFLSNVKITSSSQN